MQKMRRADREITDRETLLSVIDRCDVLRIGLNDGDCPYIVPMNFAREEQDGRLYFYLHGAAEGKKADLLRQNAVCSFQLDCDHRIQILPGGITTRYSCVMGHAVAVPLSAKEKPHAMALLVGRYCPHAPTCPPQALQRTAMWRLEVTSWSAKQNKE